MTPFSQRVHEAMDFAAIHHRRQKRKDPDMAIPYISHLFGVAYILAQHGFSEDVVVGGILHDFLEDVVQKRNRPDLAGVMREKFGGDVFALVSLVTQQKKDGRGREIDWHRRGDIYLERLSLPGTPDGAKAISCADKIHNIESLLMGLERHRGREEKMWDRLKASPKEQLEKFDKLRDALGRSFRHPILAQLDDMIGRLRAVIPESYHPPKRFWSYL